MAFDLERQIAYWRNGALEELDAARVLLNGGKLRHALFWTHLALEKALKAHVAKVTESVPPYMHSLPRLAEISRVSFSKEILKFLAAIDGQQILGRYGNMDDKTLVRLTHEEAEARLNTAEGIVQWLIQQL